MIFLLTYDQKKNNNQKSVWRLYRCLERRAKERKVVTYYTVNRNTCACSLGIQDENNEMHGTYDLCLLLLCMHAQPSDQAIYQHKYSSIITGTASPDLGDLFTRHCMWLHRAARSLSLARRASPACTVHAISARTHALCFSFHHLAQTKQEAQLTRYR